MSSPIEISARMFRWLGMGSRGEQTSVQHAFLAALMAVLLVTAVTAAGNSLYSAYGPHALVAASSGAED
jgi:hypothetical protein